MFFGESSVYFGQSVLNDLTGRKDVNDELIQTDHEFWKSAYHCDC